jgi:hypothetical protein
MIMQGEMGGWHWRIFPSPFVCENPKISFAPPGRGRLANFRGLSPPANFGLSLRDKRECAFRGGSRNQ